MHWVTDQVVLHCALWNSLGLLLDCFNAHQLCSLVKYTFNPTLLCVCLSWNLASLNSSEAENPKFWIF